MKNYKIKLCEHMIEMISDEEIKIGYKFNKPAFTFNSNHHMDFHYFNYCPICGQPIYIEEEESDPVDLP